MYTLPPLINGEVSSYNSLGLKTWVGTFQVEFSGWEISEREFSTGEFDRWVFSGRNFPGGNFPRTNFARYEFRILLFIHLLRTYNR